MEMKNKKSKNNNITRTRAEVSFFLYISNDI